VVRRATDIKLSLDTGETLDAELLAADPEHDLALLRAKTAKPLRAIPMGKSSDLMLGETIIALGNPYGFENSVTTGIVSAVRREITVGSGHAAVHYEGLVQTSALINPGNSGGPLVNILGELVGINTAVVDHAQGIGFAIPIDRARDTLAPLLGVRRVSKTWSGLALETTSGRVGARVTNVHPGVPAQKVMKTGDVIHGIDGQPIKDLFDFQLAVIQRSPDDTLTLNIKRGGKEQAVALKLAQMPEIPLEKAFAARCGIQGQDLTDALAKHLQIRVRRGVLITEVDDDGPAAESGLKGGDVIVQIGPHPVRNLQDAGEAVMDVLAGRQVLIGIVRGRYKAYTRITLGKIPPV